MGIIYNLSIITAEEQDIDTIVDKLNRLEDNIVGLDVWEDDSYWEYYYCFDFNTNIYRVDDSLPPDLLKGLTTGDISFYSPQLNRRSRAIRVSMKSNVLMMCWWDMQDRVYDFILKFLPGVQVITYGHDTFTQIEDLCEWVDSGMLTEDKLLRANNFELIVFQQKQE